MQLVSPTVPEPCPILRQLLLCRFFLLVRVREAAPGTSWPKMHHWALPQSEQIDPWAPQGLFFKFFYRFWADLQNIFGGHRTKTAKKQTQTTPVRTMSANGAKSELWASLFASSFDIFKNQNYRFHIKTNGFVMFFASKAFHLPIIISLVFHVSPKPPRGAFLDGPCADLASTDRF